MRSRSRSIRHLSAYFEAGYLLRQLLGFTRQAVARGCGLLHHSGVLLRHLIHLIDGRVDLLKRGRLLRRAGRDVGHDLVDVADLGHDALSAVPVSPTS